MNLRSLFLLTATMTLTASAVALAQGGGDIWSDPEFRREFFASYGVNADIEPRVTPEERDLLQKVYPLLGPNPAEAARQIQTAMKPESTALFDFTLGNLAFQGNELETAGKHFQTAIDKFPTFRRAFKNLGLVRFQQGRMPDAIRALTKLVELNGADAYTFGLLGYAYTATDDYLAAESAYRSALMLQPDLLEWRLGLARCLYKQQKHEETAALLDALLQSHPDKAEYWLMQANAYIGMKQPVKAAENLEIVARIGKATPETMSLLGDIYVNEALFDLAAEAYAKGLELDPGQSVARSLRSVEALAQRGALPQAKELLAGVKVRYADRLTSDDRKKLLKLEARIAVADGEGGAAVAVLQEIVALDPLDGDALMLLGQHYVRVNDPDRAIFYFERAASLEAFEADAKVRQAQVLVGQSRFREALPLLRRAQEVEPREDVGRYLEQVERLARTQG